MAFTKTIPHYVEEKCPNPIETESPMSLPPKILWSEGQALDAQHFQQMDRYHEARLQHIASAINPYAWGIHSVSWSVEGLARNSLRAVAMSLIFQDGEIYQAPGSDALPMAIDLSKLPIGEQSFIFYAALPVLKAHGENLSNSNIASDNTRYSPFDIPTLDLFTDGIRIDVSYMKKKVRLISHLESRKSYDSFPLVKVRRKSDNSFEIDPTFMPPGVSLSSSPALQEMLRNLLGKLVSKIEALCLLQRDMASFWMLSTISTAGAYLNHCANSGHYHPEHIFGRMTMLAGGLMAFSTKYAIADLPAYEHENSGPGFLTLDTIIRELLDTVASSKYVKIPLLVDKERIAYHHGKLDATVLDAKAVLYLAVNANMPALALVAAVPRHFKVASPSDIESLVRNALPGLELVHMAQVPVEVPVRPNTYYFSIANRGERYEAMTKAQAITIYVPDTMEELKLELFAITT